MKTPTKVEQQLLTAVKLVLAIHDSEGFGQVPGHTVKLDPKAEEQLRDAVRVAESHQPCPGGKGEEEFHPAYRQSTCTHCGWERNVHIQDYAMSGL